MDKDGVFLTTAVLPLAIKYTVVARWRSPADGVAGLGGLTVQAFAWADTLTIHHLSLWLNYLFTKGGILWLTWKWEWDWGKELLLERYSFMHSEKSSLVPIVMLFRSKACLRYYGCWNTCVFQWIHWRMLRVPHLARLTDFICTCMFRSMSSGGAPTPLAHRCSNFTHS